MIEHGQTRLVTMIIARDIQGSIMGTLDSSSGTLSKRGYLPYGGSATASGTFAYTGQRIDPETNGLYYYRARMYTPAWGRFMQVDPSGYNAGSNLYTYVANDPLNRLDPSGLSPDSPQASPPPDETAVFQLAAMLPPDPSNSPWQNGLVERLIGSARHECTDHVIVFNEDRLRRILSNYASYYNEVRTHLSLGKDAPCTRPIERFGDIIAQPILGGLHHRYARI